MFNGKSYKQEFDDACETLAFERDPAQIRRTLVSVEWVLAEAIRGVFFLQALLQTFVTMVAIGWLLSINSMDWQLEAIFYAVGLAMFLSIYWLSKFALWHEISRHLKPRRFGDPFST